MFGHIPKYPLRSTKIDCQLYQQQASLLRTWSNSVNLIGKAGAILNDLDGMLFDTLDRMRARWRWARRTHNRSRYQQKEKAENSDNERDDQSSLVKFGTLLFV